MFELLNMGIEFPYWMKNAGKLKYIDIAIKQPLFRHILKFEHFKNLKTNKIKNLRVKFGFQCIILLK